MNFIFLDTTHYGNAGYRVFIRGIHKLERCLPKKSTYPKGTFWNLRIGVMGRCQKVPKFDFQSQFSMSKIIRIFLNFFCIEEYQFRSTFFVIDIFLITSIFKYFLKWYPIFDSWPLHQLSKFTNFLWVYWFLGIFFSDFVPPQQTRQPVLPYYTRAARKIPSVNDRTLLSVLFSYRPLSLF